MISTKTLGNDTRTGLERRVEVTAIEIRSKIKTISVSFEVNLYSNSEFVTTEKSGYYTREGIKFEALESSIVGQGIKGLIALDLDLITTFETIDADLKQN